MSLTRTFTMAAALTAALAPAALGQTPPPAGAAAPQTPPATQTPAQPAAPPAKPAAAPVPFPADSKIAFVDINAIAQTSTAGKEASKRLAALDEKMRGDAAEKNKQLQALQTKLNTGGTVLNDSARAQLEKDVDKAQRELQFAQQNYEAEMQSLQNELQGDFQKKLLPIIEAFAKEKGLYAVFSIADAGAAYVHPGLNITDEIVKRLDAKK